MSHQVNFNTHGKELNDAYQAVISEKDDTNWLIYAFDKGTYDLRVQATGEDGLEELNDEFSDGKVQFALAKVIDPNTELPKFVFIGWCGSGVPELRKAFFNSQLSDVSKFFKSFHVQINARDEADVDPKLIMKRVAESSGANYSVHKESAKAQSRVTPVGSVYKKTEIPDIAAMQRESMTKENAPTPVGTNYKPVQTTPKKMEQRWNQASNTTDAGANTVRAEREKFEREVREREIERSRQVSNTPPPAPAAAAAAPPTLSRPNVAPPAPARPSANDEVAAARRAAQEQEAAALQQQEEEEHRRYEEEEKQRQREEKEQYRHQQEEAERQRQQQEEEQRRYEEEQHRHQQEKEERQRQQEAERKRQEAEAERHRQQQGEEEAHRRRQQQEEEEAAERQRREEEAALQAQLNQTADRAVHAAAGAAAGAAIATATVAGSHLQGVSAVVLFAYDASETNEMTLFEGEVVHQIDQVDEGWWFGVSEDGKKQGLFPANYVQILELAAEEEPAHVEAPPAAPAAPPAPARPTEPEPVDEGNVAVALYDYQAEEDNEISFNEGDVITQIEFVSDDWWQGLAASGKTVGLFPANYVELKQ